MQRMVGISMALSITGLNFWRVDPKGTLVH
jgi:hypothetical protein